MWVKIPCSEVDMPFSNKSGDGQSWNGGFGTPRPVGDCWYPQGKL